MPPHRDAITDVPGIRVGHWTDRRAATGCTVVLYPHGAVGGVDVRGGAPGTRETDLLDPLNLVEEVHAVLLTGGSAMGLDAASGVVRYLRERGYGFHLGPHTVPIVPGAVLFDLGVGRERWPDADAGYRAARGATGGRVEQGSVGAGTGATIAKLTGPDRRLKGGLGTASEFIDTGVIVGAIVAVNAVGVVRDPATGKVVAGVRDLEAAGVSRGRRQSRFVDIDAFLRTGRGWPQPGGEGAGEEPLEVAKGAADAGGSTTIAVVATNARLTKTQASRLATVCHDGFARAIWPVHTRGDGDTIFTLATGEVDVEGPGYLALEAMATRAVERAIVQGVRLATGLAGVPSASEWLAL
jgi:L-aminopeptidase/D-esterase-like protein